MQFITVFMGLGSNIGGREQHLRDGIKLLAQSLDVRQASSIYETDPWGYKDQPHFLNMVCRIQTDMPPEELLSFFQKVEQLVGRVHTFRYGPRVLDVDILTYGDQVIAIPALEIPHPGLADRAFILVPMAEIAPNWEHPVLGKRAAQLLKEVSGSHGVRIWGGPLALP